jgi:hypothetical protein
MCDFNGAITRDIDLNPELRLPVQACRSDDYTGTIPSKSGTCSVCTFAIQGERHEIFDIARAGYYVRGPHRIWCGHLPAGRAGVPTP